MLDIEANRRARKYPLRVQMARIAWVPGRWLFRLIPRPFHRVRSALLRLYGARIASDVQIYPTARIEMPWNLTIGRQSAIGDEVRLYNPGRITVGCRVTISHRAHLCAGTHDYTDPAMPLLKPPITIKNDAWICADAFVGPGVRIGAGAVVAARAVAVRNVAPWTIVGGNPAREIGKRKINGPA